MNWETTIKRLLPPFLRQIKLVKFLSAAVYPLSQLFDVFVTYRDTTIFNLQFSAIVAELEYYLNHIYSTSGIWIEDFDPDYQYLYAASENNTPLTVYLLSEQETAQYIYTGSENENCYNYVVWIPDTLNYDADMMRSYIDQYNLAGKNYQLNHYTL